MGSLKCLILLHLAAVATAQSLSSLPQCGQTCINNMIQIASSQLGCSTGNVTCYCIAPDFGYGVRDCANQTCPNSADASEVISFGTTYCADALGGTTASSSNPGTVSTESPTASSTKTVSTVLNSSTTTSPTLLPSTLRTTSSSTIGQNVSTSPGTSPSPVAKQHHSSLSAGAGAGIGVGAILALLLVAGIVALLLYRRRKAQANRRKDPDSSNEVPQVQEGPQEMEGVVPQEKDSNVRIGELVMKANTHEMDEEGDSAKGPPAELAGS